MLHLDMCERHQSVMTRIADWDLLTKVSEQYCLIFSLRVVKTFWFLVSLLVSM
jgi:hypothetical protein